jgi:hypothetical protein
MPAPRKEAPPMTNTTDPEWDTFSKTWGHADAVRIFATGGRP